MRIHHPLPGTPPGPSTWAPQSTASSAPPASAAPASPSCCSWHSTGTRGSRHVRGA